MRQEIRERCQLCTCVSGEQRPSTVKRERLPIIRRARGCRIGSEERVARNSLRSKHDHQLLRRRASFAYVSSASSSEAKAASRAAA